MPWQAGHCIKDETLQVEDSILLLKIIIMAGQAEHCIKYERLQDQDNISLFKKTP